jgi:hypothetical protein
MAEYIAKGDHHFYSLATVMKTIGLDFPTSKDEAHQECRVDHQDPFVDV